MFDTDYDYSIIFMNFINKVYKVYICDILYLVMLLVGLDNFSHNDMYTEREDQPVRLLLNLLFYQFNHSETTYKS